MIYDLKRELQKRGVRVRLTGVWGCPSGTPMIKLFIKVSDGLDPVAELCDAISNSIDAKTIVYPRIATIVDGEIVFVGYYDLRG